MNQSNPNIIIQARMGSSRLPQKVLRPFYGTSTILDIIVDKFAATGFPVVLATSTNPMDDAIEKWAQQKGIDYYRGSEDNVIERFMGANQKKAAPFIVRVCADNPFINVPLFLNLWEEAKKLDFHFDYLSYSVQDTPAILTHYGVFVEIVRAKALKEVLESTNESLYLEHVTNYLYQRPEEFKICFIDRKEGFFAYPDVRLTVDTESDFNMAAKLYQALQSTYGNTDLSSLNDYLANHPQLLDQMREQIRQNEK